MFKEFNNLSLFFEEPNREFNVREYSRLMKISPATASKILQDFYKKEILNERKDRMLKLYKSNLDSDFYRDLKVFYNIRKLKDSDLIPQLNNFYLKPTIVLFGSASFGMDNENSDWDMLVISEKKEDFIDLKKFEKKLKRKIQMFNVRKVNDLGSENLINSVLNGIVIQGRLKWI